MIEIFTDGASKGNPGPGGYGVILRLGAHYKELSAGFRMTTNNRMELMAVIIGLEAINKENQEVTIFADSKYVIDPVMKGWLDGWQIKNFKDKKNSDLWRRLIPLLKKHTIKFTWVRGHAGHPENERCDELAVQAALNSTKLIDTGYENQEIQ